MTGSHTQRRVKCPCCPWDRNVVEPIQQKRKPWSCSRITSVFLCLCISTCVIVYGFYNSTDIHYKLEDIESRGNLTIRCYKREEKQTFPVLFNIGLGLFGIFLGLFIERFVLFWGELCDIQGRYKGNICKALKACFSGISWLAVIAVLIVIAVSILAYFVTKAKSEANPNYVEWKHLVLLGSGIGVGPLITHLLNLDTQSEVHVSKLFEERVACIADTLAYAYYFNYLEKALPNFAAKFPNSNQRLTENKLILLISHDCRAGDHLHELDNTIKKRENVCAGNFNFPIYELTNSANPDSPFIYAVQYAKDPLEAMYHLTHPEPSNDEDESKNKREYQAKQFYIRLSKILKNPNNPRCKEKCILVPIKVDSEKSLRNGGLVKLILREVLHQEASKQGVFLKPFLTTNQRSGKIKDDNTSSGQVSTDHVEGNAHYRQNPRTNEEQSLIPKSDVVTVDIHDDKDKQKEGRQTTERVGENLKLSFATDQHSGKIKYGSTSSGLVSTDHVRETAHYRQNPRTNEEQSLIRKSDFITVDIHDNKNKQNKSGQTTERDGDRVPQGDSQPTFGHTVEYEQWFSNSVNINAHVQTAHEDSDSSTFGSLGGSDFD